jgi:hypothetical protein
MHLRLKWQLKSQKGVSPKVLDKIPAEFIHAGGRTAHFDMYTYLK